jgi:hypothetical protein
MFRLTTANPAKLKKLIKIVLQVPTLQLRHAMKAANYTDDEISDIAFRCFLQRNSPGGLIQGLRVHVAAVYQHHLIKPSAIVFALLPRPSQASSVPYWE